MTSTVHSPATIWPFVSVPSGSGESITASVGLTVSNGDSEASPRWQTGRLHSVSLSVPVTPSMLGQSSVTPSITPSRLSSSVK